MALVIAACILGGIAISGIAFRSIHAFSEAAIKAECRAMPAGPRKVKMRPVRSSYKRGYSLR